MSNYDRPEARDGTGLKQSFRAGWEITMFALRYGPFLVLLGIITFAEKLSEEVRR